MYQPKPSFLGELYDSINKLEIQACSDIREQERKKRKNTNYQIDGRNAKLSLRRCVNLRKRLSKAEYKIFSLSSLN